MRILFLSLYFPPEIPSTGVLMGQLCHQLQKKGHDVTVITGASVQIGGGSKPHGRFGRSDEKGMRILRVPVPVFGEGESFVARTLTYTAFNVLSLLVSLFCGRQDIVVSPSPPLTNGVISWLAGALKRAPTVYNIQDLVSEAYIQFGVLKNRTAIRLFERLESLVYQENDHLSVISESFADHLRHKGVPDRKISVIPNFVDTEEITGLPRENQLSRRLGLNGYFVVMHAGSIAYRHGVEILVDTARLMADEKNILFLIVGEGSKRQAVEERAKAAQLTNFRMLPYLERSELPLLRACADVQMIVLRRGMTSHSVPCKVYEIMASARPFIAAVDEGSTIWQLADETESGIGVPPESPEAIAAAIQTLYRNPEVARRLAANGRREAVANYSVESVARQYEFLFQNAISQTKTV